MRARTVLLALGLLGLGAVALGAQSRGRPGWLRRLPSPAPHILAFELGGHVGRPEIRRMAETVLAAFDRFESVDMLVVLPEFTGLTPAAALDLEGLKAGFRSLGKVRRYAVVEPPKIAALMIETSDWFMPVQARTFPLTQRDAAEAWVARR
ncbi:STAS/SEC14 domain-containing protein [Cereibacter sphaeroides]|jgi:hypothetical protein|uniref:STAS/SEC14 domain-containing protein n=1 Tax=Cereibacter sphaeroides TaxID=1063 RepID=UPI0000665789|nr:hypothetical protein Rsph17029_0730 [Cereibacter sphaeroides ATCC 17029]